MTALRSRAPAAPTARRLSWLRPGPRPLALALIAAVIAAGVTALVADGASALVTLAMLVAVGGAALTAAQLAAARRRQVGTLSRQFALAIAIAVGQMLVAVVATALLMFVSGADAVMISIIVVFVGFIAVLAAQCLIAGILRDIETIRDALVAVGAGERDLVIATSASDELAQLADAANVMLTRLKAEEGARNHAEAARHHLIAAVSHDLRTPITSLQLLTDAIDDGIVDDATRRRYLRQMGVHIRAMSGLIDDLFELSRLEAGDIRWSLEQVRLDELVSETVAAMRVQAQAKGVAVIGQVAAGAPPARANPEKVQRVLFNLVQNAIRHTPTDGSVTVRAEPSERGVEIEVADTGDGIAPDERDRVFDAFFRGGTDRARTTSGAGLGLAISRAIVEAHGGRIWLADGEHGTRVRFSLPAAASPV